MGLAAPMYVFEQDKEVDNESTASAGNVGVDGVVASMSMMSGDGVEDAMRAAKEALEEAVAWRMRSMRRRRTKKQPPQHPQTQHSNPQPEACVCLSDALKTVTSSTEQPSDKFPTLKAAEHRLTDVLPSEKETMTRKDFFCQTVSPQFIQLPFFKAM